MNVEVNLRHGPYNGFVMLAPYSSVYSLNGHCYQDAYTTSKGKDVWLYMEGYQMEGPDKESEE